MHFLTSVNINLQGTCIPLLSLKFTGFPVTTVFAATLLIGSGQIKKDLIELSKFADDEYISKF